GVAQVTSERVSAGDGANDEDRGDAEAHQGHESSRDDGDARRGKPTDQHREDECDSRELELAPPAVAGDVAEPAALCVRQLASSVRVERVGRKDIGGGEWHESTSPASKSKDETAVELIGLVEATAVARA